MQLKNKNNKSIKINDQSFAGGGQGTVHMVMSSAESRKMVAKIYGSNTKMDKMHARCKYMVDNDPFANSPDFIKKAFAWPVDLLYDSAGNFKGILMPFVEYSKPLSKILNRNALPGWSKFMIDHADSYNTRIKICYNIARALSVMHQSGQYVLIDFKDANMMINKEGFVTLIDLDSIQINNGKGLLLNADVYTPEFAPPELHNKVVDYQTDCLRESWDRFSYAVMTYKLLFNIHPFGSMTHKSAPNLNTNTEFIQRGYFANGKHKSDLDCAPPHANFDILLGPELKDMFIQCFDNGHDDPEQRPALQTWSDALKREIDRNQNMKVTAGLNQPDGKPAFTKKKTITLPKATSPKPVIQDFSYQRTSNSIQLNWRVINAVRIHLNGKPVRSSGNTTVPFAAGVHTLEAMNATGDSVSRQVTINALCSIDHFDYTLERQKAVISWQVSNAKSITLNNKAVSNAGSMDVSLQKAVYTLTVTDSNGVVDTKGLHLKAVPLVKHFEIIEDQYSAKVSWDIYHAREALLNDEKIPLTGDADIALFPFAVNIKCIDFDGNTTIITKTMTERTLTLAKPQIKLRKAAKFSIPKGTKKLRSIHAPLYDCIKMNSSKEKLQKVLKSKQFNTALSKPSMQLHDVSLELIDPLAKSKKQEKDKKHLTRYKIGSMIRNTLSRAAIFSLTLLFFSL